MITISEVKDEKIINILLLTNFKYVNNRSLKLFNIKLDDKIIGHIVEYDQLYHTDYVYIDILIYKEFRGFGYGSTALELYLKNTNKKKIYIKAEKGTEKFLTKNKFMYIKDNLYNLHKYEKVI